MHNVVNAIREAVSFPIPMRAACTLYGELSVRDNEKLSVTQVGRMVLDRGERGERGERDIIGRDRPERLGALGTAMPWTGVLGGVGDRRGRNRSLSPSGEPELSGDE